MSYHVAEIERGVYGEPSKIGEEYEEFLDAREQGVAIMELVELSDMLGAVKGYLAKYHKGTTLQDLIDMQVVTERAFATGHRSSR